MGGGEKRDKGSVDSWCVGTVYMCVCDYYYSVTVVLTL
jgi:hypothetical protein